MYLSLTLSGYHHIDILDAHQKYLGFSWEFDGKIHYFVLVYSRSFWPCHCSFCFYEGCMCITVIKDWRSLAIHIFAFVDDVFRGGSSFKQALTK